MKLYIYILPNPEDMIENGQEEKLDGHSFPMDLTNIWIKKLSTLMKKLVLTEQNTKLFKNPLKELSMVLAWNLELLNQKIQEVSFGLEGLRRMESATKIM